MKKVLVAISGGIAAYKALDVISRLRKDGNIVYTIATDNGKKFVSPTTLGAMSDMYIEEEDVNKIPHIDLAAWCDVFLLLPATANTIAKCAVGIADNLVTATFLALPSTVTKMMCPAMNTNMYLNDTTQTNISKLKKDGVFFVSPIAGHLACGTTGVGKLNKTEVIVEKIYETLNNETFWRWPLSSRAIGITSDSYSYLKFENKLSYFCEIPIFPHVGSFGIARKFDIHKGVDLYGNKGDIVTAVEDGCVLDINEFTGVKAGSPWWFDSKAVYIEGKSGVVLYGEIEPNSTLTIGQKVKSGDAVGCLLRVLKTDKGRPLTMLHIGLYTKGVTFTETWNLGEDMPMHLVDPTEHLIKSYRNRHK